MIEISEHAREAMEDDGISEEEISACLEHGETEIKEYINGEVRYGKKIELKNKTVMVIFTNKDEKQRVITCYLIRRKKW